MWNQDCWSAFIFYTDPNPAFFLQADLDKAAFSMRIRVQLKNFVTSPYEDFATVEKKLLKSKNYEVGPNLLKFFNKITIITLLIFLHF